MNKQSSIFQILLLVILFFCGSAIAQTNVIGNPIKIGNIEVAQYDFPDDMEWDDANRKCLNLSEGWRLPTKDELVILYNNKKKIENNNHPHKAAYWSSTENDNAWWYIYLPYGQLSTREKNEKFCVRAVRSVGDIERRAEANLITNSIKYSKKKNTLNLFINEQTNVIVVLITEMDKRGLCYSYYIHLEKGILEKSILERGNFENSFSELDLPFQKILTTPFTNKESKYKIRSFEKNQNIFADIKRKDNGT